MESQNAHYRQVSMVSSLNLAYTNLRLQEILVVANALGQNNVLFVGNLLQLLPAKGEPVFAKVPQKDVALQSCKVLTSVNFWKDSIVYNEQTINPLHAKYAYMRMGVIKKRTRKKKKDVP